MPDTAPAAETIRRVLAVRFGGLGDLLQIGPAIRALAKGSDRLTLLTAPEGAAAAELLTGIDEVLVYTAPWIDADAPPLDHGRLRFLQRELSLHEFTDAVIFTTHHQSPLPMALLLRIAGVPRISAISTDDSGSLLDVRHQTADELPESRRALSLAAAAGFELPAFDDGDLAVLRPLPAYPDWRHPANT